MNPVERTFRRIDLAQRGIPWLAFPFAVFKKFGDDQAGALAALVAYYGFFSMFPLLLLFVSVLGLVLGGSPGLQHQFLHSALSEFPVIGPEIGAHARPHGLTGSWLTAAVGAAGALWAGLGVAQAAQHAMNVVWDIPRSEWPNFIFRRVRAAIMLVILGFIFVLSTFASGISGAVALPSALLRVTAVAISLLLNVILFALAFQVLTARDLKWRHVMPGAVSSAVAWTILQVAGGYYLTHEVRSAGNVYGTFALVIGLLVWISLGGQVTLYGAEINVVWFRRLWPRSMVQPPINDGDCKVYRAIAERAKMRPEVQVSVSFTQQDGEARGRGREDTRHADGDARTRGARTGTRGHGARPGDPGHARRGQGRLRRSAPVGREPVRKAAGRRW